MLALLVYLVVNITHAAGHLLAARLLGIRIERISLGLGPTIWQRSWRGTTIRLTPIPVGLLVRLRPRWVKGEEPPAIEPGDFNGAGALARLAVICAPPLLLLLLGWGAAFHLHGVGVLRTGSSRVGGVQPDGPAERAGLRSGDVVEAVEGQRVESWSDLTRQIAASKGRPLGLQLRRGKQLLRREVTPRQVGERWLIGITAGAEIVKQRGVGARAGAAVDTVLETFRLGAAGMGAILAGSTRQTIGGPVQVQIVAQLEHRSAEAQASRRASLVTVGVLKYLLICLLPIPFLDGRRLVFWFIGLAARGRLHPRWEQGFNRWGFAVVGVLLVVVTATDVWRLVS